MCQYELAVSYQTGRGLKKDLEQAKSWYAKSAQTQQTCSTQQRLPDGGTTAMYRKEKKDNSPLAKIRNFTAQHLPKEAYEITGHPSLTVTFLMDGTISQIEITRSSGPKLVDEALVAAIYASASFPPFRTKNPTDSTQVTLPIEWHLPWNNEPVRPQFFCSTQ